MSGGLKKGALALLITLLLVPSFSLAAAFERPLSQGMSGTDVSALQTILKEKGFFNTDVTGFFGPVTLQAVADFQTSVGLESLGYVGPQTRAFLNGEPAPVSFSNSALLSSLISQLQQLLRNVGYYMVSLTGTLDQVTLQAAQSISSGSNSAPVRSGGKPQQNDEEEEIVLDTTAPVLSSIVSSTATTTATVSWTTDEPATTVLNFGQTSSYGTASTSAGLSTSHTILLSGLTASTTYHFQVRSLDEKNNIATSSDLTFTTLSDSIDPSSVAGLIRWYSASAITGVSDGGAIATWPDRSVANDTGTQATSANRPTYKANGLNGHPTAVFNGTNSFLSFTPVSDIRTAVFVLKATRPYTGFAPILGHASLFDWSAPAAENPRMFANDGTASAKVTNGSLKINGTSIGSTTLAMKPSSFAVISMTTTGTTSAQYISNDRNAGTRKWRGEYADVLLFDRVLDSDTLSGVEAYLAHYYAIALNSYPSYDFKATLLFNGDSMTAGVGATGGQNYYTQLAAALPSGANYWPLTSLGSSGRTADTLNSAYSSESVPRYNASVPINIDLIWIGTNDLFYGTSAAETYDLLKSIWAQSRARGFKVVAFTALSRSNAGTPAGFNTARAQLNTLIRSDASLYDGLVDVAADSRIGYDGAEVDTTYFYSDLVHMNNTGYGIIAGLAQPVVAALAP